MAHASARRRPGRSGRHRHRATRHVSEGNWWVARNDGEGFVNENWGAWSANVDWLDVLTADFDGDGRDDVVGRANGKWWVARSDGVKLVNEHWGAWSANVDWLDVLTADFDGDGRDDVVGRANGKWWVARSDGSSFVNERWGTWTDAIWRDAATGLF